MPSCVIETPVGRMRLAEDGQALTRCDWTAEPLSAPATPLLTEAVRQLSQWFRGERTAFDLPICLEGTPFQLRCWEALQAIPYGETLSYGEQARRIGSPKAARAVGGANHRNPISIIVPCHRVIGAGGSLTGYGGGMAAKKWLLAHEQRVLHGGTAGVAEDGSAVTE